MNGFFCGIEWYRTLPLQIYFESIPWWAPVILIAFGVLLYGVPYVDSFIGNRLEEWQTLPAFPRMIVVALLISGSGLIVFIQLGQYDWMYVLFLFTYTRAVEGATIIHLFGRVDQVLRIVYGETSDGGGSTLSKLKKVLYWFVRRLKNRMPLLFVTTVLTILSVVLSISVLLGFPQTPLTVRLAAIVTVVTFALSTVNTAWVLRKVTDELGVMAFLGVVFCVVGGESYNVPAAFSLFSNIPALEGPFSAWTTITVGLIGWFVGLLLAVVFFAYRIRQTEPDSAIY